LRPPVPYRASQAALAQAGRTNPSGDELTSGVAAMERGATSVQLSAFVGRVPSGRSAAVAIDAALAIAGRGTPMVQALAQVESKLAAGASDGGPPRKGGPPFSRVAARAGERSGVEGPAPCPFSTRINNTAVLLSSTLAIPGLPSS